LLARLQEWAGHWCAPGDAPDAAPAAPPADPDELTWRGARHGGAVLWLGQGGDGLAALGARLVGEAEADASGLGERLAARALDDLMARLLLARADRLAPSPAPQAADLAPGHGAIGFTLSGLLSGWVLFLDAGACDLLAPGRPTPRAPLSARTQAIGPEPVTLEVVLPLGELALSESLSLQVGEVLLAGALADAAVRLQSAAGHRVAEGALARQGEGRAIRIEHNHVKQGLSK
jgi:hypothetical protein